jgi:hypothetical protein
MPVDDNPDDLGLISRQFENPEARLLNFAERVSTKYLDVTIGSGQVEKYLYELYYDLVFVRKILSNLGALPKLDKSSNAAFEDGARHIANMVIDKVVSGEIVKSD